MRLKHLRHFKLIVILATIVVLWGCKKASTPTKKLPERQKQARSAKSISVPRYEKTIKSHFGLMPATDNYKLATEAGAYFDRPNFEMFSWERVEPVKGRFNFSEIDKLVKELQSENFHPIFNIQSYNHWDQGEPLPIMKPENPAPFANKKPKDIKAYKAFVSKLVERYDKDGKDDMPGLKYPIIYWEVLNEPSMQEPPLAFFSGSPKDYYETLKASYEAIKEANPKAKVLQAGVAGMKKFMTDFWTQVFNQGAANYFDIANIHDIGQGEALNLIEFKDFLAQYNISKPIWITEVELEDREQKRSSNREYAASLVRAYCFGLANGAEKLFYVNFIMPANLPSDEEGGPGFTKLSALVTSDGKKQEMFYAHKNLAKLIDNFSSIETIKQQIGDREVTEGQYKFIVNKKPIYVLWGGGAIPQEIKGKVKVIDILGNQKEVDVNQIQLSKEPIFVMLQS